MAIFLCRWPNGDFSVVSARTKSDAIELLDEWGNAEQALLTRMTDCMFDFRLNDDGQFELADTGEVTHDCIMETCYPELDNAFATAEWDETGLDYSAKGRERIRAAVKLERTRLLDGQTPGKVAETGLGREIQDQTGAPSVLVNRIVREATRKRLEHYEGEGKKPN
ncbi:MAG: hypothetical protein ABSB35_11855 [Bryobacteraceae bacterium]|jgi:hypothetical protein